MANDTIIVPIENNTNLLTALTLAREGHRFRISHINFEGINPSSLGIDDQLGWNQLAKEAWNNQGNINSKPVEESDAGFGATPQIALTALLESELPDEWEAKQ